MLIRMRATLYLVLFLCLPPASLTGQGSPLGRRVTLVFNGSTLPEAFAAIGQATGLAFTYSPQHLPDLQLDARFEGEPLKKVLSVILEGTGLSFTLSGSHIVIFPDREAKDTNPPLHTLSGYIRDADSGEELIGSYVLVEELSAGTATNAYGFYSLALPEGRYRLRVRYMGYMEKDTAVRLEASRTLNLALNPSVQQLEPIIISASPAGGAKGPEPPASGKAIEMDLINEMPGLLGEQDVLQSLQLLPGVASAGDAVSAISVRGGAADHNLYLLDEAPVFYDSHMSGFFSIFNPDVVKHVSLYKNHIPARYQGRLASVIDVRTKEGDAQRFGASGGTGIIASRLLAEGPLLKDKASFLVAARRSHMELYSSLLRTNSAGVSIQNSYSFTDINAKTSLRLGAGNRLFLSAYYGNDLNGTAFEADSPFGTPPLPAGNTGLLSAESIHKWNNRTFTLRWNCLFNERLFKNTSVIFHDFQYRFTESGQDTAFAGLRPQETTIEGVQVKMDFQYFKAPGSVLKFGAGLYFNRFGYFRGEAPASEGPGGAIQRRSVTSNLYAAHEWEPHERAAVDYGIHFTRFTALGTGSYLYQYGALGERADSSYFGPGQPVQSYYGVEPRVSVSYATGKGQWLTLSYNRTYQYVQRISRPVPNDPANIWLPAGQLIRPQHSGHLSLEYTAHIGNGAYEATLGLYYKKMGNQPGYRGGATLEGPPADLESLLIFGETRAGGAECLIRKNKGAFRAWASYTFSAAEAHFSEIDGGLPFPTDVLRPHVLSLATVWDVNKEIVVVGRWVYLSGKTLTIPVGKYTVDGISLDYYPPRNAWRLEDNHRFDISVTVYRKGIRDRGSSLNVSLINVYARKNPSHVYLRKEPDGSSRAYQVSLTPFIIPSLTYNFRF